MPLFNPSTAGWQAVGTMVPNGSQFQMMFTGLSSATYNDYYLEVGGLRNTPTSDNILLRAGNANGTNTLLISMGATALTNYRYGGFLLTLSSTGVYLAQYVGGASASLLSAITTPTLITTNLTSSDQTIFTSTAINTLGIDNNSGGAAFFENAVGYLKLWGRK